MSSIPSKSSFYVLGRLTLSLVILCLGFFFGAERLQAQEGEKALSFANYADESGPLRLEWEPVSVITDWGIQTASWTLTNHSNQPITSRLSFYAADTVTPVDEDGNPVPQIQKEIAVPPQDSIRDSFSFTMAEGTYNAHYPLHLKADFESEGKTSSLHAVRVVEFRIPPQPKTFQTTTIHHGGVSLIGKDYRARYRCLGCEEIRLGENYIGSDPASGATIHQYLISCGKAAHSSVSTNIPGTSARSVSCDESRFSLSVHPPYLPCGGSLYLDYPVKLPNAPQIDLAYACAIRETAPTEPPSDGVTFRVWMTLQGEERKGDGGKYLIDEIHTDSKTWLDRTADLSPFAGQEGTLTIEFNTGPKNDSTCDSSFMSGLLITGRNADGQIRLAEEDASWDDPFHFAPNLPQWGTEPIVFSLANGFQGIVTPGSQGLLDASFTLKKEGTCQEISWQGLALTLGNSSLRGAAAVFLEPLACYWDAKNQRLICRGVLLDEDRPTPVALSLYEQNGLLVLDLPAGNPKRISGLELGPMTRRAKRIYAAHGFVLEEPKTSFKIAFEGHRLSTSHVGFDFEGGLSLLEATAIPPDYLDVQPDAQIYSLIASGENRLALLPTDQGSFAAAIQYRDLSPWRFKASQGVRRKAGRLVFDDWDGNSVRSQAKLEKAFAYGVTDSIFVKHVWQRWGYDVRLPDIWGDSEESAIYPAFGTLAELRSLADCCRNHGVPFALHDNYIDFYPDAEGFTYKDILFNKKGDPQKGWINYGKETQSYRFRPDRFLPHLLRNLDLTRRFLPQTNAYFVDVFSSISLMDFLTEEGEFHPKSETRLRWQEAFRTIGERLAETDSKGEKRTAITISEAGNDSLIGGLDGADAQWIGISQDPRAWSMVIPCQNWARTPWYAAVNHSNFIRHGVGYEDRYIATRSRFLHGMMSDDYLSMEVLGGVDQMVDAQNIFPGSVRKHFLAQHLIQDRAKAEIQEVSFAPQEGEDQQGEEPLCLGRQKVVWTNGTTVYANRHRGDWRLANGVVIPHYGYYAEDSQGNLLSAIIRNPENPKEVIEMAQNGDSFYLNGRGVETSKVYAIEPKLGKTAISDDGSFQMQIDWLADEPAPENLRTFIHIAEPYLGYGHHPKEWVAGGDFPSLPTTEWGKSPETARVSTDFNAVLRVPDDLPPGNYRVMVGLYQPNDGKRLPLVGDADAEGRYAIADLILKRRDGKPQIEITPIAPDEDRELFARLAANQTSAHFRGVSTLGAVSVTPQGDLWTVLPIPVTADFDVALDETELGRSVDYVAAGVDSPENAVPITRGGGKAAFRVHAENAVRYYVRFK